ncbi:MAG: COG2426 family protein [Patescibacteria group bacterium]
MLLETSQAVEFLKGVPPEISTMIISMTPVFELRGAIPVGIGVYKMTVAETFIWSVLGNIVPVIVLVFFLEKVTGFLMKHFKFWRRFFEWLFERTRRRAGDKIDKYGDWGLFFLVAIPLPVTGGWTGSLAAFLFGIKKKKSIPIISLGIFTAGVIVTILTIGIGNL